MLGSPFSTNRAKAVLKPSPAPSTNKASLLFWLVQFLAAKQIVGGDNLPCGFLAPSVGFWRDFQHVFRKCLRENFLNSSRDEVKSNRTSFELIFIKFFELFFTFQINRIINFRIKSNEFRTNPASEKFESTL